MHLSSWSLFYYLKKKKWELIIKNRILSSIRKSNNKLTDQFIRNVSVTPCFVVLLLLCLFLLHEEGFRVHFCYALTESIEKG